MTDDPYGYFKLSRDATPEEIKHAYRKRAKEEHPDAGGDAEAFKRTSRYAMVLLDPKRREKFDRTGSIDESAVDNSRSEAMQVLGALLEAVINAYENERRDPLTIDLASEVRRLGKAKLDEIAHSRRGVTSALKKAERYVGRFKLKGEGINLLDRIMQGRCQPHRDALRLLDENEARLKAALEIAKDYDFEADPPPKQQMPPGVFMQRGTSASTW